MKSEAETTRRHFDIMAEKIGDSVEIVAEVTRAPRVSTGQPRETD